MSSVLIVEDEPWLSDIYSLALVSKGIKVLVAPDAQDGLDILDDNSDIELIVVDMLLPHHNGLSFLYEAASHIDWQNKRYIILSSVPREELSEEDDFWRQLNVIDYLYKPAVRPEQFADYIVKVLG